MSTFLEGAVAGTILVLAMSLVFLITISLARQNAAIHPRQTEPDLDQLTDLELGILPVPDGGRRARAKTGAGGGRTNGTGLVDEGVQMEDILNRSARVARTRRARREGRNETRQEWAVPMMPLSMPTLMPMSMPMPIPVPMGSEEEMVHEEREVREVNDGEKDKNDGKEKNANGKGVLGGLWRAVWGKGKKNSHDDAADGNSHTDNATSNANGNGNTTPRITLQPPSTSSSSSSSPESRKRPDPYTDAREAFNQTFNAKGVPRSPAAVYGARNTVSGSRNAVSGPNSPAYEKLRNTVSGSRNASYEKIRNAQQPMIRVLTNKRLPPPPVLVRESVVGRAMRGVVVTPGTEGFVDAEDVDDEKQEGEEKEEEENVDGKEEEDIYGATPRASVDIQVPTVPVSAVEVEVEVSPNPTELSPNPAAGRKSLERTSTPGRMQGDRRREARARSVSRSRSRGPGGDVSPGAMSARY